jgi:hypothetical protein
MISILLCYSNDKQNRSISYHYGWSNGFIEHPKFNCIRLNLAAPRLLNKLALAKARSRSIDAVVILHSAFSNAQLLKGYFFEQIQDMDVPKIYFVGNEYKLMPEKIAFAKELQCALFITQAESKQIEDIYSEAIGCPVESLPGAGLSANLFRPRKDFEKRPIDLGFRAADEPAYFYHQDRMAMAEYFLNNCTKLGLKVDISVGQNKKRFNRNAYADFLNNCKGQLGTEGGPAHFDLTDKLRLAVNQHTIAHPDASFEEINALFFPAEQDRVPLRIITGRNIEAAGTKTVQLLFEGNYSGHFHPDEHYLPIRKDFSNIEEAMEKFRDRSYCNKLTDNAYDLVMQEFTYQKLIDKFYSMVQRYI